MKCVSSKNLRIYAPVSDLNALNMRLYFWSYSSNESKLKEFENRVLRRVKRKREGEMKRERVANEELKNYLLHLILLWL